MIILHFYKLERKSLIRRPDKCPTNYVTTLCKHISMLTLSTFNRFCSLKLKFFFRYVTYVQEITAQQNFNVEQLCQHILPHGVRPLLDLHGKIHRDHVQEVCLLCESHYRYSC